MIKQENRQGLYIVLISVHGLMRGRAMELGRDADTGGQILYVVELARALAAHPQVAQVDLLTRRVMDKKVSADYAQIEEPLCDGARIVRLECGPRRYLRKEVLWPYLDTFVDQALQHIRGVGRVPDILHSHYADAGYIGSHLAGLLGIPLVHTGHSLGRDKREQLLRKGAKESQIESQYTISRRIEAEESTLDSASLVIASTAQEVEQQYARYDNYQPKRMVVLPPGVDLSRFQQPRRYQKFPGISEIISPFLRQPNRPAILALSRADERKNIAALVHAYGQSPQLRELANLIIVAGNRDDIDQMEKGSQQVLNQLLKLIDRYDLYGLVAYPKHHSADDVPHFYQYAAYHKGVFVNPALTEPFGLTLIEAAASGLPVVATHDGGPSDIIKHCKNGLLIDPLDVDALARSLTDALSDKKRWRRWSESGVRGAHRFYSWPGHADNYVRQILRLIPKSRQHAASLPGRSRLPTADRIAITSIDNALLGDNDGLLRLIQLLKRRAGDGHVALGVATGRRLDNVLRLLKQWSLPVPDLLITSVGSEIHYGHPGRPGHRVVADLSWQQHINFRWQPERVREVMTQLPGIKANFKSEQGAYKISYYIDPDSAPSVKEIKRHLRRHDLHANVIASHDAYLDILPIRASKGQAIRYLALKWGIPLDHFLVVGDSGNDAEMLRGDTLAVVVANHSRELEPLKGRARIYFASNPYALGIIEGLEHYNFFGDIRIDDDVGLESLVETATDYE